MKKLALVFAMALVLGMGTANAAEITWDAAVSTLTGNSDVISTGLSNLAGADLGASDGTSVVNGVTFTDALANTATTLSNGTTFNAGPWNVQGDYGGSAVGEPLAGVMDNRVATATPTHGIMSIGGLTIGSTYTIQFFVYGGGGTNWQLLDDSGGAASPAFVGASEQFVTGSFTADAATQGVTIDWITDPHGRNYQTLSPSSATLGI